jgi:ParB-like chromosome segregation protein Spo0J
MATRYEESHMELEFVSPDSLLPHEDNPRLSNEAVSAVARSIKEFGFNAPIITDEAYRICAGHVRWQAARELGLETIPIVRIPRLRGRAFAAYNIADNQTASLSSWNLKRLAVLLAELREEESDLTSLGFTEAQLDALLTPEQNFDWQAFDERLRKAPLPKYAALPVKVPRAKLHAFKRAVRKHAKEHGITGRDAGVLAGRVVGSLLRVTR